MQLIGANGQSFLPLSQTAKRPKNARSLFSNGLS
jgi:hypothetical protein